MLQPSCTSQGRLQLEPASYQSLAEKNSIEFHARWAAGALQVIMTVLRDGGNDMCQRAMDVLLSVVQHDAGPLRDHFTEHTDRDDFKLLLRCRPRLLATLLAA